MLDSVNLLDKTQITFAKRFVLVLFFQVKIQSLVYFAVGYKYTKLPKRAKTSHKIFSLFHSEKCEL